ncbi:MAG: GFA family protein [Halieaceae bacterium]|nr:GFA family protein [Halieaceae bacterium]
MTSLNGSCLCGSVALTVQDQFVYAGYCHCSRCRKASGAAGVAIGGIPKKLFEITRGAEFLARHQRSEATDSYFCGRCGSTLYGEKPLTGMVHVRYGVLDEQPTLAPQAHMHVASKAGWYEITDSLPQFATFPPS